MRDRSVDAVLIFQGDFFANSALSLIARAEFRVDTRELILVTSLSVFQCFFVHCAIFFLPRMISVYCRKFDNQSLQPCKT